MIMGSRQPIVALTLTPHKRVIRNSFSMVLIRGFVLNGVCDDLVCGLMFRETQLYTNRLLELSMVSLLVGRLDNRSANSYSTPGHPKTSLLWYQP